jgi:hypothetical protein
MKGVSQLNKWASDLKWRGRECIYTPHSQSQPLSANSAFFILTGRTGRCDRMRPVGGNGRFWIRITEWPDALWSPIGDNRTRPVDEILLWKWTGRTVDASDQFLSRVRLQQLRSLSLVNTISASGRLCCAYCCCQYWLDASGQDKATSGQMRCTPFDSESRRDLNQTYSIWSLGCTWAT